MALFGKRRTPAQMLPAPVANPHTTGVLAPVAGRVIPLAAVDDGLFSRGTMGGGVGILPSGSEVRAPITGTLTTVFPTGHAYGVRSGDGVEVLVHIGLDTVELRGRGFTSVAAQGQAVTAGDLLGTFDTGTLKAAGKDITTLIVVTNTAQLAAVDPVAVGDVDTGDVVIAVDTGAGNGDR